ncbi:hypothetical protein PIGHUM_00853 [Pigmentiphaga humi]|uniref:Thioredoxin domain-containing protein n=1 Tax=Pigmentiphaga humi TaxID=2478468 RepID=A0A3P4B0Z0_9BURK|nr:SCO family protein [Pigmentiphaga humi]VCU68795.1 hypothetical protein PIGHUM_00853 [Pigmentiphaga humi]
MRWLAALAWAWSMAAAATDFAPTPFTQRLGAQVPVHAPFVLPSGVSTDMASLMAGRPAILVLGYYHCPMLCETTMDGILESVRETRLDYAIIAVGIDPAEGPADAARKLQRYTATLDPHAAARLHLLTGRQSDIDALARAVGFPYRYDPATMQFGHPAGFVVLTPEGRISRYMPGVRFSSRDVRLALTEAAGGRVGGLADRLLLFCAHYDPATGRYSAAVMRLTQAAGAAVMMLTAALVWRQRRRTRSGQSGGRREPDHE